MPDLFDTVQQPLTRGPASVFDYDASAGEAFGAGFEGATDLNPLPIVARTARTFSEDLKSITGEVERVTQKDAQEEVRRRGLDIKVPVGGMTRYELDTLQYLKQREIRRQIVNERTRTAGATLAGFAGGFAGGAVDPINIASAFIPIVGEARYAAWLAKAGESFVARAATRAAAGAIEGGVGAALVEPIVYAGAQAQQADYTGADSFLNVMFGTILGGGLHVPAGAIYDARVSRALRGLDTGIHALSIRDAAGRAPDDLHLSATMAAVRAFEDDAPVNATGVFVDTAARAEQRATAELARLRNDMETARNAGVLDEPQRAELMASYEERVRQIVEEAKAQGADPEAPAETIATAATMVNGEVYRGINHTEALAEAKKKTNLDYKTLAARMKSGEIVEGFETTSGRFVTRGEAAQIVARQTGSRAEDYAEFGRAITSEQIGRPRAPVPAPAPPRRTLSDLLQRAKSERTEATFNRQFTDEALEPVSRAADVAAKTQEPTPEDIASDTAQFQTHLDSMRERGLVDESMEASLRAADAEAESLEAQAKAYEAAAVCELEP